MEVLKFEVYNVALWFIFRSDPINISFRAPIKLIFCSYHSVTTVSHSFPTKSQQNGIDSHFEPVQMKIDEWYGPSGHELQPIEVVGSFVHFRVNSDKSEFATFHIFPLSVDEKSETNTELCITEL